MPSPSSSLLVGLVFQTLGPDDSPGQGGTARRGLKWMVSVPCGTLCREPLPVTLSSLDPFLKSIFFSSFCGFCLRPLHVVLYCCNMTNTLQVHIYLKSQNCKQEKPQILLPFKMVSLCTQNISSFQFSFHPKFHGLKFLTLMISTLV